MTPNTNDMIFCNLKIHVNEFVAPSGAGPYTVNATMSITSQSTPPNGGSPYFSIATGGSLSVDVPYGTPVQLSYSCNWNTPGYFVIVGAYFTETPRTGVGIGAFPLVILNTAGTSASATALGYAVPCSAMMTVVDQNSAAAGGLYQYNIAIQNLPSLALGIFDPAISNDYADENVEPDPH